MKLELFNSEAAKIWKSVASESSTDLKQLELDLHKRLPNFFHVGDFYYFIFNFQKIGLDLVSKDVETVLGYPQSEITAGFLMDKIHPEDRTWFLSFQNRTAEFLNSLPSDKIMNYKSRFDCRFKKKDGGYLRLLHQSAVIQIDDYHEIVRTLVVHTDITHLKKDGRPVMSYIGMNGEPSYLDIDVKNIFIESPKVLTKREKEVLILLTEGNLSKEIGDILHISKKTVDRHRKNMLERHNFKTTAELVGKAIRGGWI